MTNAIQPAESVGSSIASTAFDATSSSLPAMVKRAAGQLASASTAAEVLDARNAAKFGRDLHKREAGILKAKGAHSEIVAKVRRGQADCLELEAAADKRLADEYDRAQERGEVATRQNNPGSVGHVSEENMPPATAADLGLSRKDIHEARAIRDAEAIDPGVVQRALDEKLAAGEEPTRAAVKAAVAKTLAENTKAKDEAARRAFGATLPQAVKDQQQATAEWRAKAAAGKLQVETADRIAELEEHVRVLEAEAEELRAENKTYREMKVQFALGGFEKIVSDKDEVIRVLRSQVEHESREKASWARSSKFWREEAVKLGYSSTTEIDIDTGEILNG